MRGENRNINRDRLVTILKETASYDGLTIPTGDANFYRVQRQVGLSSSKQDRVSGVFQLPEPVSAQEYFYGRGLVNAEAAVRGAQRSRF
jgi:hypothetical protein